MNLLLWFISLFTKNNWCNLYKENRIFIEDRFDKDKHYELMKNIRNYYYLSNIELEFIKTLPKKKLIEIIEIVNINTIRMNELFKELTD